NAFATTNYNGFGVSCSGACDGAVSVTIAGGTGNFSRQWAPAGPTTANWAPVCAGGKLVTVIDLGQGVGCFASVQVTAPLPLGVIFFGLNPPTCADVCNGTAVTFPGGGTEAGYVYDWNNGVENTSNPSQLCAGINSLELEDNNGCIFDTTFTIDLLPLLAELTFTDALCAGDCDGTAEVTVSGGTPQYSFNWEPGAPNGDGTGSVTGLCPGNLTVAVADANGCDTLISFSIAAPPPLVPNLTFLDAACFGACDGSAGVAPPGGSGNFLFDWEPGAIAGDGTPDVTGLCAGPYSVLITDQDNGCDTLVQFIIGSAPAIDVQLTITDAGCNGECDGAADVVISGGTPGYVISWTPGIIVGQGTPNASQLCAGDYAVTITDAAGCDTTLQFTIAEPDPIEPNIVVTNVSCFGVCDGTITCGPTGGTPGFTFSWTPTPPAGDGTSTVSGLCAGDWTVSITDAAGCDTTITVTITEPPPLVVQPAQTNISCGTDCDGTATVIVSGGSPDYTYDWSGSPSGDGTPSVTGLCAGTYTVQVLDSALCEVIQSFTIEPPHPLVVAITTVNATCPDFCNGSATAVVSGGNDP
ncbi:MAG: SprB repeat-containing protein, partial [Flavobacteriales bacterium]|nr:SprB repeat-containing protein [Flavobacteriales bacterium]